MEKVYQVYFLEKQRGKVCRGNEWLRRAVNQWTTNIKSAPPPSSSSLYFSCKVDDTGFLFLAMATNPQQYKLSLPCYPLFPVEQKLFLWLDLCSFLFEIWLELSIFIFLASYNAVSPHFIQLNKTSKFCWCWSGITLVFLPPFLFCYSE